MRDKRCALRLTRVSVVYIMSGNVQTLIQEVLCLSLEELLITQSFPMDWYLETSNFLLIAKNIKSLFIILELPFKK